MQRVKFKPFSLHDVQHEEWINSFLTDLLLSHTLGKRHTVHCVTKEEMIRLSTTASRSVPRFTDGITYLR